MFNFFNFRKNYRLDRTRLIEIIDLHFTTSYLPENYDHLPETAESLPETAKTTVQNQMNKSVCFDLPDIDDSSEIVRNEIIEIFNVYTQGQGYGM